MDLCVDIRVNLVNVATCRPAILEAIGNFYAGLKRVFEFHESGGVGAGFQAELAELGRLKSGRC
ncbi:MAG: hypothetical protein ACYC5Q_11700 [Thermoleophilia bacterium]